MSCKVNASGSGCMIVTSMEFEIILQCPCVLQISAEDIKFQGRTCYGIGGYNTPFRENSVGLQYKRYLLDPHWVFYKCLLITRKILEGHTGNV